MIPDIAVIVEMGGFGVGERLFSFLEDVVFFSLCSEEDDIELEDKAEEDFTSLLLWMLGDIMDRIGMDKGIGNELAVWPKEW